MKRYLPLICMLLTLAAPALAANGASSKTQTASNTISFAVSVLASGDSYRGSPELSLLVNGKPVATATVTANHSANKWQTLNFKVTISGNPQTVGIDFLNDADAGRNKDRNLYIEDIVVNGTTLTPQQGTYRGAAGAVAMYWSGTLSWNVANLFNNSPAACGTTPSGSTVTKQLSQSSGTTAATVAQCPFGGTQPTLVTVTQAYLCTNGALTAQGSSLSTTADSGNPTCNPAATNQACGTTPSGSTVTKQVSQTSGTTAASATQCPSGGTQPTLVTVTQVYLCTNGALAAQGSSATTTANNGSPTCNAAAACGTTPSGSTVTKQLSQTSGTTAASATQCPSGGTQPTLTTVTQTYLCTNGALAAQGSSTATTANNGSPTCNAAAACGTTPSGSTVTQQVSQTSGTTAASATQCPSGGTQPTIVTVTQAYLCTNGALAAQGSSTSTTVNNGSPTCNTASINGLCGAASGSPASSAPTANLCSTGTASAVSGNNPWSWGCTGSNGGSTAECATVSSNQSLPPTLATGTYTSPAATTEIAKLCVANSNGTWPAYPPEWTWSASETLNQPAAATSGTPRVEQYVVDATSNNAESVYYTDPDTGIRYRLGAVYNYLGAGDSSCDWSTPFQQRYQAAGQTWDGNIATAIAAAVPAYQLPDCGPFAYSHKQQSTNDGDLFLVYPAVYSNSAENGPHIGETYGVYGDPATGYDALVAAQTAWTNEYGSQLVDPTAGFETVPPEPTFIPLNNVTIKGLTVNNQRPVLLADAASDYLGQGAIYIGCCSNSPYSVNNLTIENIDVVSNNAAEESMRAAVYVNGATNLTLKDMRITGFESAQANGILTTGNTAGTLTVEGVELYHDGGVPDDYAHHTYFGHSGWDPNFTVHMLNSWSHDAYAGHLMKSRAQITILEGNYFQGTLPQSGLFSSEDYDADIPNGGTLIAHNNVFVKTLDDNGTGAGNRIMLAYAMEGIKTFDGRVNSVDIQNNTFVGLNAYWLTSNGYALSLLPMNFSYPSVVPDPVNGLVGMTTVDSQGNSGPALTIPASAITINQNAFVGLCGDSLNPGYQMSPDPIAAYRGNLAVIESFSELNQDYSLTNKMRSQDTSIVGTPAYSHAAQRGLLRATSNIGAED